MKKTKQAIINQCSHLYTEKTTYKGDKLVTGFSTTKYNKSELSFQACSSSVKVFCKIQKVCNSLRKPFPTANKKFNLLEQSKHTGHLQSIKNILFNILGCKLLHLLNCNKPLAIPFAITQRDSPLRIRGHFSTSSMKILMSSFSFLYMQHRS